MKKLLALLLAILMIATVALVSCNNKKGTTGGNADEGANTEEDNGLVIPNGVGSSDTTDAGSDSTDTSNAGNQGGNNTGNEGGNKAPQTGSAVTLLAVVAVEFTVILLFAVLLLPAWSNVM